LAFSSYKASLGATITAYVKNIPARSSQVTLHFKGTYAREDGTLLQVNLLSQDKVVSRSEVHWTDFGPFNNPFSPADNQIGAFTGTVAARVVMSDGTVLEGPTTPLHFEVLPSLVIEQFEPVSANCGGAPAKRAFGGLAYRMRVRAVGFQPGGFIYTIQFPQIAIAHDPNAGVTHASLSTKDDGSPNWQLSHLLHSASSNVDTLDGDEAIYLPPLPDNVRAYPFMLTVDALDNATGNVVRTNLVMRTQSPIDITPTGIYQLAELLPARPVSGCLPGGAVGRWADYSDTLTEASSRSFTYTVSQAWMNSISNGAADGAANSWTTIDGQTYSQSVQDTSGWSQSQTVSHSNTQAQTDTTSEQVTNGVTVMGSANQAQGTSQSNAFNIKLADDHSDGSALRLTVADTDASQHEGSWSIGASKNQMIEVDTDLSSLEGPEAFLVELASAVIDAITGNDFSDDPPPPDDPDPAESDPANQQVAQQEQDTAAANQSDPMSPTDTEAPAGASTSTTGANASADPTGTGENPASSTTTGGAADPTPTEKEPEKDTFTRGAGVNDLCPGGPCSAYRNADTDKQSHTDSTRDVQGQYESNGWSAGSSSSMGSNESASQDKGGSKSSSDTNSKSTSTGSSTTETSSRQSSVYGYRASTDASSALQVDMKGGTSSMSGSTTTTNSEQNGNATSNDWRVTSSETIGTHFRGFIVANMYGVFYRQRARYQYQSLVSVFDKCGEQTPVGQALFEDYVWAADLAVSDACPPAPRSNFPEAQCYLPPCSSPTGK
jgi:hypothetical protein